jgi:hypothetical protein
MNQQEILQAVKGGKARFTWATLPSGIQVMAQPLRVNGWLVPVSARTSQLIADHLTSVEPDGWRASLPTPRTEDEMAAAARFRLAPPTLWQPGRNIADWEWTVEATRLLDTQLLKFDDIEPGDIVAGMGKSWCLTSKVDPDTACNYGNHMPSGGPYRSADGVGYVLQPVGHVHNPDHVDYSQTCRLVRLPPGVSFPGVPDRQPGVDVDDDTPDTLRDPGMSLGERALLVAIEEMGANRRPSAGRRAVYFAGCVREVHGEPKPLGIRDGNWCAASACWCVDRARRPGETVPHLYRASGIELERDAMRSGSWIDIELVRLGDADIQRGDVVILSRGDRGSWTRHVARVELVNGSDFTCVDGNSGGQWRRVVRSVNDRALRGFVRYQPGVRDVTPHPETELAWQRALVQLDPDWDAIAEETRRAVQEI